MPDGERLPFSYRIVAAKQRRDEAAAKAVAQSSVLSRAEQARLELAEDKFIVAVERMKPGESVDVMRVLRDDFRDCNFYTRTTLYLCDLYIDLFAYTALVEMLRQCLESHLACEIYRRSYATGDDYWLRVQLP
jgi:hypothetical protein